MMRNASHAYQGRRLVAACFWEFYCNFARDLALGKSGVKLSPGSRLRCLIISYTDKNQELCRNEKSE